MPSKYIFLNLKKCQPQKYPAKKVSPAKIRPVFDQAYGATKWNKTKIMTLIHNAFCLPQRSSQLIINPLNSTSCRNVIANKGNNGSSSNIQSGRSIKLLVMASCTRVKIIILNTSICHQPLKSDSGFNPSLCQLIFLINTAKTNKTILVTIMNKLSAEFILLLFYHRFELFKNS